MGRDTVEAGAASSGETAAKATWPIQTNKAENEKEGYCVQLCRLFTAQSCSAEGGNGG